MLKERLARSASAALIALSLSGCGNNDTSTPEPTAIVQSSESENSTILDHRVFQSSNYSEHILEQAQAMWLQGTAVDQVQRIGLPNGNSIILAVKEPTYIPQSDSTASTSIDIQALELEEDQHYVVVTAQGNLDPNSYNSWDEATATQLREIDIQHERLIFTSQLNFLTESLLQHNFDLGKSFEEQNMSLPPSEEFLNSFRKINDESIAVTESIAELADFYLLKNLVDKNSDGSIRFVGLEEINNNSERTLQFVPTINTIPYQDGGIFYILATTIAPFIHEYDSFEELTQNYVNFTDIPGFKEYYLALEEHFKLTQ